MCIICYTKVKQKKTFGSVPGAKLFMTRLPVNLMTVFFQEPLLNHCRQIINVPFAKQVKKILNRSKNQHWFHKPFSSA